MQHVIIPALRPGCVPIRRCPRASGGIPIVFMWVSGWFVILMIKQERNNLETQELYQVNYIINSTIKFQLMKTRNFKTELPWHHGCSRLDKFDLPYIVNRMLIGKRKKRRTVEVMTFLDQAPDGPGTKSRY